MERKRMIAALAAVGLAGGVAVSVAQQVPGGAQTDSPQGPSALQQDRIDGGIGPQSSPSAVRRLQQALNQEGFDAGPVDGVMGPRTRQALIEFQQARGLEATGVPDRRTLSALGVQPGEFAAGEFPGGRQPGGVLQQQPRPGAPGGILERERRIEPGQTFDRRIEPGGALDRRQAPGSTLDRRQPPGSTLDRQPPPGSTLDRSRPVQPGGTLDRPSPPDAGVGATPGRGGAFQGGGPGR